MPVSLSICNAILAIGLFACAFGECGWNLGDREEAAPAPKGAGGDRVRRTVPAPSVAPAGH